MAWQVDLTLIRSWLAGLDQNSYEQVIAALELLQDHGPRLGRPLVDSIRGSKHPNMKELRPGSKGRSELRVLFAFDPQRRAILLVAGDKSGNWKSWYRKNLPLADQHYDDHLTHLKRSEQ